MTITGAALRAYVEPVINETFDGIYAKTGNEWDPIFDVRAGKQRRFYDMPVMFGFNLMPEKGEGAGIEYDEIGEAYRQQILYRRYALAAEITEDAMDDAEELDVGMYIGEHLARSAAETEEVVHADILNRAITAGYTGGDGQTLLSAAHPLAGGGTFSNYLAGVDLSDASLKQLLIMIRKAPDERGKKINLNGIRVVVPPDQEYAALEILDSELQSGTANNNINSIRVSGRVRERLPHVMRRLSAPRCWFVTTDAPRGLIHRFHPKGRLKRGMEGDFQTGNARWKVHKRYCATWVDPRGIYGGMGT